jgi:DNA-binding ferritin-like protein
MTQFTIPGLTDKQAARLTELLQKQLSTYNDLHLTLKHIHWNVVGPNFIGVHEMIDPQVEAVRGFADDVAERIAALGASPQGTPGAIIRDRSWDDYSVDRDTVQAHLAALDLVYKLRHRRHSPGHRRNRRNRPGHPGPLDRPSRKLGEVPVVRPGASGKARAAS